MKKLLALFTFLLSIGMTNAENLRIIDLGTGGVPGQDEPQLMGLGISANGEYVCGSVEYGVGYFVYNLLTGEYGYEFTDDVEGAELRNVSDQGLAIGYNGPGITYSIDGGENILEVSSDKYKYVLGEDLTNDGTIMVGSLVTDNYETFAAYCAADGEWKMLPMPDKTLLGAYGGRGSMAKQISGDGKVILGHIGNFGPAIIWKLNDSGEYEADPISLQYVVVSNDDADKQFIAFTPKAVSNDGKLVLLQVTPANERISMPAVYNVETEELTLYSEALAVDEYELGLQPAAISDNGTIIGIIGSLYANAGGFIIKAGEKTAQTFPEAFPEYADTFSICDALGYHVPIGISADGASIMGYAFYSEDLSDPDIPAYFITYVIETEDDSSVETVASDPAQPKMVEFFGIDGSRRNRLGKGVNIVRMQDGTVRKLVK